MMTGRPFAVVEGANLNVAEHWTDAHLLRGREKLAAKQYREALADFEAAITLPSNLPAGLGFSEGAAGGLRAPEFAYWTGVAYEAMGDRAKAAEAWKRGGAALQGGGGRRGGGAGGAGAQSYYQALCLQKSGENDKATALFQSLVDSGQSMVRAQPANTGGGRGGFGTPAARAHPAGQRALPHGPRISRPQRRAEGQGRTRRSRASQP